MFKYSNGREGKMQSRAVDEFCLMKVSNLADVEQYNERHITPVTETNRAYSPQVCS